MPRKRTRIEKMERTLFGQHLREDRARDRVREGWGCFESRLKDIKFFLTDIESEVRKRLKGRKTPLQVMDLGCGAGNATKELAKLFGKRIKVTGTGLSRNYKWTDRLGDVPKNVNWRVVHATQLARKFPANHFHLIYSNYGIYHEMRMKEALQNVRKILKLGGVLIFNGLEEEGITHIAGLKLIKQAPAPNGHVTYWLKKVLIRTARPKKE